MEQDFEDRKYIDIVNDVHFIFHISPKQHPFTLQVGHNFIYFGNSAHEKSLQ